MWKLNTPIKTILEEGRDLVAAAGDAPEGCTWVAMGLKSLVGDREGMTLQEFLEAADSMPRPNARKIMLQGLIFPYTMEQFTRPALLFTVNEVSKDPTAAAYLLAMFNASLPEDCLQRAKENAPKTVLRALGQIGEVKRHRRNF